MGADDDHDLLIRIEGKVDQLLVGSTDHEDRIRSLERWKYGIPAGLALTALTAFATVIHR